MPCRPLRNDSVGPVRARPDLLSDAPASWMILESHRSHARITVLCQPGSRRFRRHRNQLVPTRSAGSGVSQIIAKSSMRVVPQDINLQSERPEPAPAGWKRVPETTRGAPKDAPDVWLSGHNCPCPWLVAGSVVGTATLQAPLPRHSAASDSVAWSRFPAGLQVAGRNGPWPAGIMDMPIDAGETRRDRASAARQSTRSEIAGTLLGFQAAAITDPTAALRGAGSQSLGNDGRRRIEARP